MSVDPQSNIKFVEIEYGSDYDDFLDENYYIDKEIIGFEFRLYSLIDINKIFKIYKQNKQLSVLNLDFLNFFEDPYNIIILPKYKKETPKIIINKQIQSFYKLYVKLITQLKNLTDIKILNFKNFNINVFNDIEINPSIKKIYLCNVNLTILSPLCNSLNNIKVLDLWNNNISDLTPLCEVLKTNTSIKRLELCYNNINNLEPLIKALETNQGLKEIYINYNPISSYRQLELLKSIAESKHIKIDI